jgi:hypothetical protein
MPTDITPLTRYVKGETRYMKIQKPGNWDGDAKTLSTCQHIITIETVGELTH